MQIPVDQPAASDGRKVHCVSGMCGGMSGTQVRAARLRWGPVLPRQRRWPQSLLIVLLLGCTLGAVAASYLVPVPSFVKHKGERPGRRRP